MVKFYNPELEYVLRSTHYVLLVVMRPVDMAHELGASLGIGAEHAAHGRGDHFGVGLLHTAHYRAEMHALSHYRHPKRIEGLVDEIGDLDGQALLNLQPPREHL